MAALKLSWETPFRWLGSLLAIATVFSGFHEPIAALGGAARYFWLFTVAEWLDDVNGWLTGHVAGFAMLLPLLVTLAVCGAYRGSVTLAEPRACSTFWYVAALAAYAPDAIFRGWAILLAGLIIGFVVARVRGLGGWTWLGGTAINIAFAGLWVPATVMLWLFVLTPAGAPRSASS